MRRYEVEPGATVAAEPAATDAAEHVAFERSERTNLDVVEKETGSERRTPVDGDCRDAPRIASVLYRGRRAL